MDMQASTASSVKRLASFYRRKGLLSDAEKLYRVALLMQRRDLGNEHIDVAVTMYQLAETYSDQDKYLQAEGLYRRAVEIFEKCTESHSGGPLWNLRGLLSLHELSEQEMEISQSDISAA